MASNETTKPKATKKSVAKPASETRRDIVKERLEFVLTCIEVTGIKLTRLPLITHKRLQRAQDYVDKLAEAREAARQDDNKAVETSQDEEA
ncbi:hypothetical protein N7517_006179 [Penicillium concentricum]|uniref:Uncharacterized protein n=1 Tax=Penicillium concentricum TaxID=293559 RepID=A0A9W9SDK0_9EURO|nr:uncharacterized protein N7517_006179 [Penicillium concentricum]KAJ5374173.1 hypothetical protein N7517_006179 [Penicillium concentricum]